MVSTVWPFFAVLLLTVPLCPAICRSGKARVPRAPWSRRHSSGVLFATADWNEERRGYRRRGNRDCPSTSQITKERGREGTTEGKNETETTRSPSEKKLLDTSL